MNTTDSESNDGVVARFSDEPVIGHHIEAEIEERDSIICDVIESYSGTPSLNRYVELTESDVDWEYTNDMRLNTETFEALIEWYERQRIGVSDDEVLVTIPATVDKEFDDGSADVNADGMRFSVEADEWR